MAFTPANLSLMAYTSGPSDKRQIWFYLRPGSDNVTTDYYFDKAPGMRTGDFIFTSTGVARYVDERVDVARPAQNTVLVTTASTDLVEDMTLVVAGKTYTIKDAVTDGSDEGDVKKGGTNALTMVNLIKAINASGTNNTDYKVAAAHPTVKVPNETATIVESSNSRWTLEARSAGTGGNDLTLVQTGDKITVGGATFSNGRNVASTTTTAINT